MQRFAYLTALAVLFAISLCPASAAPVSEPWVVPFTVVQGVPVIDVQVNGAKKHLILDSGASTTILRQSELGGQHVTIMSATGRTMNATKCTAAIDAGDGLTVVQATCGVPVPANQDGLLGEDFLSSYNSVSVDYKTHTVTFKH